MLGLALGACGSDMFAEDYVVVAAGDLRDYGQVSATKRKNQPMILFCGRYSQIRAVCVGWRMSVFKL